MGITLKRFVDTFLRGYDTYPRTREPGGRADVERKYPIEPGGLFTVQYPEEKVPVPERFRNIPMLIYEPDPDSERAEYGGNRLYVVWYLCQGVPAAVHLDCAAEGQERSPRTGTGSVLH